MGNTTHISGQSGGTVRSAAVVHGKWNGEVRTAKYIHTKRNGVVKGVYSVLSASASSVDNITAHGASTTGTPVTGMPSLTFGGNIGAVTFSWTRIGGDSFTVCSDVTAQNPTFSRLISNVANGTPSDTIGSTWRGTLTDGETGATTTVDIACAVQWTNDIPAYSPHDDWVRTSGGGSIVIPTGAPSVTIYVVAAGGGGGNSTFDVNAGIYHGGGNGGKGGVNVGTYSTTGLGGQSISFSIGAGGGSNGNGFAGGSTSITGGPIAVGLAATGGAGGAFNSEGSTAASGSPSGALIDPPYGSGGNGAAGGGADTTTPGSGGDGEILFRWN